MVLLIYFGIYHYNQNHINNKDPWLTFEEELQKSLAEDTSKDDLNLKGKMFGQFRFNMSSLDLDYALGGSNIAFSTNLDLESDRENAFVYIFNANGFRIPFNIQPTLKDKNHNICSCSFNACSHQNKRTCQACQKACPGGRLISLNLEIKDDPSFPKYFDYYDFRKFFDKKYGKRCASFVYKGEYSDFIKYHFSAWDRGDHFFEIWFMDLSCAFPFDKAYTNKGILLTYYGKSKNMSCSNDMAKSQVANLVSRLEPLLYELKYEKPFDEKSTNRDF